MQVLGASSGCVEVQEASSKYPEVLEASREVLEASEEDLEV